MARGFTFVPETIHLETMPEHTEGPDSEGIVYFNPTTPDLFRGKDVRYKGRGVWVIVERTIPNETGAGYTHLASLSSNPTLCTGDRVVWAR